MKHLEIGQKVIVYDRFRFAVPLKAIVSELSTSNDDVRVTLEESGNQIYQEGCTDVWVHAQQLVPVEKEKELKYFFDEEAEIHDLFTGNLILVPLNSEHQVEGEKRKHVLVAEDTEWVINSLRKVLNKIYKNGFFNGRMTRTKREETEEEKPNKHWKTILRLKAELKRAKEKINKLENYSSVKG